MNVCKVKRFFGWFLVLIITSAIIWAYVDLLLDHGWIMLIQVLVSLLCVFGFIILLGWLFTCK